VLGSHCTLRKVGVLVRGCGPYDGLLEEAKAARGGKGMSGGMLFTVISVLVTIPLFLLILRLASGVFPEQRAGVL
jgi:hypothetical protein